MTMPDFPGHPLFDTLDYIDAQSDMAGYPEVKRFFERLNLPSEILARDFEIARQFLLHYSDSPSTFARFRSEIQRFLNVIWIASSRTLEEVDTETIAHYFTLLKAPPRPWISTGIFAAFECNDGERRIVSEWRPFAVRSDAGVDGYTVRQATLGASKTALQNFFKFILQRRYISQNPMLELRRKDYKASEVLDGQPEGDVRRYTDWQWAFMLETLMSAASENPKYERHLFVVVTMKSLFLRVSELAPRKMNGHLRTPVFGDFRRKVIQGEAYWSYDVVGKGGKKRSVTLPEAYIPFLRRWREHNNISPSLPGVGDQTPIFTSSHGGGLVKRQIQRACEQSVLLAAQAMRSDGFDDDAHHMENIKSETHYLRHTGASQAIESGADIRHVSEELGHSSPAFTESVYINADQALRRYQSRQRRV